MPPATMPASTLSASDSSAAVIAAPVSRTMPSSGGWWGRRRPPRRAEEVLPDADRFDRILHVELMRADRSGTTFCLAVFGLPAPDAARPDDEYDFAVYLMSRLRATDHAGVLNHRRLAVVLWDTTYEGATVFVKSILEGRPAGPAPTADIYVYPFDKLPPGGHRSADAPPGQPLEDLLVQPLPRWKRALDVIGASVGLLALSPLMCATAAIIKWTDPGPAFFTQTRDGLGGRKFLIWKFRTMYIDAEARKAALRAQSEQDGPAFKMAHDPRITPIGRYLRKTCIDELPQLWNVLKGDMSLVGPRPLDSREAAGCEGWQRRRQWVTPGLTCIWQVDGKSRVPFKEWMRMDLRYMSRRTLGGDLRLVFRTACAVVMHKASQ